ncbi:hypothetical protein GBAR_LOCUS10680 [Geodia barretti]|uniref:Uncharacterized protein n=2 Tax=Geodia barretti TaxID=519541 RepID=A0AA35RUW7_GEOBA|nr:hypothetical protein GBAR_LOCUS10680 [Geodia barretti]
MSGVRPKRGMGPERPSQKKEPARASTADVTPRDSTESSPALTDRPFLERRAPKLLMLAATIVVGIMFILAFSFCLAFGIKNKQPRYFLLLINIILSTGVTVLLIFWYYRRILQPALIWYVFLQCLFLFFQCVTTDIFAFYESPITHTTETPSTLTAPLTNLTNSSPYHNNSTIAIARWPISR